LKRRFLVWNMTGSLVSRDEATHHTIDIDFADATRGRPASIRDHHNFELGALDDNGALFAAKADGEIPGVLMYKHFKSSMLNSDWSMELPKDEDPVVLTCAKKWCALATTKSHLRIFSAHGGLQKILFSLRGPVVAMVGHGDRIAVVCHGMQPHEGQNLELLVYDVERQHVVTECQVVLSDASHLKWLGFATTGMLCIADSAGLLRGLSEKQGWQWVPLLDMQVHQKTKDDSHWIVGVTEDDVMCVLLKQGATEPHVEPRPMLETLPVEVPLLKPDPDFHALESKIFRRRLVMEQEMLEQERTGNDTGVIASQADQMDRELLQMIHQAMKAEKEGRVLELGIMFNSARALQNAIKLAHVSQLTNLAQRLTLIGQAKFASQEDLPARKRTREVQFKEADEELDDEAEEAVEEAEEQDCSQPLARQPLSPMPPVSRRSPAKRVRIAEMSPEEGEEGRSSPMKENTGKQDRTAKKATVDQAPAKQLFGSNPFAKNVAVKSQAKTMSAAIAGLGRPAQDRKKEFVKSASKKSTGHLVAKAK